VLPERWFHYAISLKKSELAVLPDLISTGQDPIPPELQELGDDERFKELSFL